jgi:hypothetical protein
MSETSQRSLISVAIPTYNSSLGAGCDEHVPHQTPANYESVVVDHGFTDWGEQRHSSFFDKGAGRRSSSAFSARRQVAQAVHYELKSSLAMK